MKSKRSSSLRIIKSNRQYFGTQGYWRVPVTTSNPPARYVLNQTDKLASHQYPFQCGGYFSYQVIEYLQMLHVVLRMSSAMTCNVIRALNQSESELQIHQYHASDIYRILYPAMQKLFKLCSIDGFDLGRPQADAKRDVRSASDCQTQQRSY